MFGIVYKNIIFKNPHRKKAKKINTHKPGWEVRGEVSFDAAGRSGHRVRDSGCFDQTPSCVTFQLVPGPVR